MQKKFRKLAKVALVLVYLVIAAGAVVRMTGSGMGCPDWPKCFGYYIPPTEASQLAWQPEKSYNEGQVIIISETLKVAKKDFTTATEFSEANWEPYTKHDYAIFNPWHTWIEFINRLMGALAGLATLILAFSALRFWREAKKITLLSWLVVFGMGFQAWLGATVVYSVLEPVKITVHMIMALVIVALLLYIIHMVRPSPNSSSKGNGIMPLLTLTLIVTLAQIIMGTQVRQFVDSQIDIFGETAKHKWLADVDWKFYVHRSFSIIVVLLNLLLARQIFRNELSFDKIKWVLTLLTLEVASGIAMYYLDFPFASQPLHLILASLLFGVQFYLFLEVIYSRRILRA